MSAIDFGYRTRVVRATRVSARVPMRLLWVSVALFATAAALALFSIRFGKYPLTVGQVLGGLFGTGEDFHVLVVREWRMPIALAAVTFGAVLGLGGAIFQSLTRNPLGSPDIIGFDTGSYTAVVVMILVVGTRDYWKLAAAAVAGGILTALVVYVLSWRRGIQGFRLIIVGIGVTAMLGSVNAYLMTRAKVEDAMVVGFWGAGSIARVSWASMLPALALFGVIAVTADLLAPSLRRLELGDDAAVTHGTNVGRSRLALIVVGVAGTALVTAAAGPIVFIALVAPQLARRLTGSPGVSLVAAAGMGAALLSAAHLLSLVIETHFRVEIPVGLITVCIGGLYLIWLLIRESRRRTVGVA